MRFSGQICKDGKFWLAEIPILELMTQGRTEREAYEMVADMLESMVNREGFRIEVFRGSDNRFEVGSSETRHMIGLLLQRKREISGLSPSRSPIASAHRHVTHTPDMSREDRLRQSGGSMSFSMPCAQRLTLSLMRVRFPDIFVRRDTIWIPHRPEIRFGLSISNSFRHDLKNRATIE